MVEVHGQLGLDCLLHAGVSAEGEEAPAGRLLVDELDPDRLPGGGLPRQPRQPGLVHDQLDVDIVQAGEDHVAVLDIEVCSAEAVSVLQLPLKVPKAGDVGR